jgi:DNA-binding NarL/FixJ family response regulator
VAATSLPASTTPDRIRPIRVLIVDDHPRVRSGLADLLATTGDLLVAGVAHNGAEGMRLARELAPDVVLVDLSMPEMNGQEVTAHMLAERPQTRILILTAFAVRGLVDRALASGAVGSVLKDAEPARLFSAIRAAAVTPPST